MAFSCTWNPNTKNTNPHRQSNLGNGTCFFDRKYVTMMGSRNKRISKMVKLGEISGSIFSKFTVDFSGCVADI